MSTKRNNKQPRYAATERLRHLEEARTIADAARRVTETIRDWLPLKNQEWRGSPDSIADALTMVLKREATGRRSDLLRFRRFRVFGVLREG